MKRDEALIAYLFRSGFTVAKGCKHDGNWFGASTYRPDIIYERGKQQVVFSLSGTMTPPKYSNPKDEEADNDYRQMAKTAQLKYVAFREEQEPDFSKLKVPVQIEMRNLYN